MANQRQKVTTAQRMARKWGFGDIIWDVDLEQYYYGDLVTLGGIVFGNAFDATDVANDSITDAKLRNSAALSSIGRSANSVGDPGDMVAGTDGHVLRRSGNTLGFGEVVRAGIADDAIGPDELDELAVELPHIALAAIESIRKVRMRSAAFSGLGASGVGAFASHALQLTGAEPSFEVEMVLASKVAPSLTANIWGSGTNGFPALSISANGAMTWVLNGVVFLGQAPAGTFAFDGPPKTVRLTGRTTGGTVSGAIFVDGVQVASGSGSGTWDTSAFTSYIGGFALASGQRWPGSIHNVKYTDLVTAASSRTFLMDEVVGDFADSSGNGGAAAVRNGYVPSAAVVSTDGRGMPWQGGVQTLVYSGYTTAAAPQAVTADTYFVCATQTLDPTASFDLTYLTAPCAARVEVTWSGAIRATALAGTDTVALLVSKNGDFSNAPVAMTFTAITSIDEWKPVCVSAFVDVVSTDFVGVAFTGIVALDTYDMCGTLTFKLTPSSVPG